MTCNIHASWKLLTESKNIFKTFSFLKETFVFAFYKIFKLTEAAKGITSYITGMPLKWQL